MPVMAPPRSCWLALLSVAILGLAAAHANDFCPSTCSCDDDTLVVTCIEANLNLIPITLNPSIRRLVLKYNKIRTTSTFQFYGSLQFVDLSYNHLMSVPSKTFETQRRLLELHLNHNKISSVTNTTFLGLGNLTVLSLRGNYLETLSPYLFGHLGRLEELDLGQNRISSVDPNAFARLASLRVLYLDDNQLSTVPTPSFPLLHNLAELHIGLNSFNNLSEDAFSGLGKLNGLDLGGAGLQAVSENSFRGLPGLRTLVLADNKLTRVPTRQLAALTRLEDLTIGQNEMQILEAGAFRGLTHLRRLDVSGAYRLERVERGALRDNLNLETLILSSNKRLSELDESALAGLPNLRHLVLRDNALTTLHESLATWPALKKLDVSDNPLDCTCQLLWLRELLARRNESIALCATPSTLKERPLASLAPDELGCATHDAKRHAVFAALAAAAVLIVAIIALLLFRYRRGVHDVLKGYKWNNRAISRKEHEYQKTFSDEDYMVRAAGHHPPPHHLLSVPNHQQPTLKPIPVTEL